MSHTKPSFWARIQRPPPRAQASKASSTTSSKAQPQEQSGHVHSALVAKLHHRDVDGASRPREKTRRPKTEGVRPRVSRKISGPDAASPEGHSWQKIAPRENTNYGWRQDVTERRQEDPDSGLLPRLSRGTSPTSEGILRDHLEDHLPRTSSHEAVQKLQVFVKILHPLMQRLSDLSMLDTIPTDLEEDIKPCLYYWAKLHNDDPVIRGSLEKIVDIAETRPLFPFSEPGDVRAGTDHSPPNSDARPHLVGGPDTGDEWNSESYFENVDAIDIIETKLTEITQEMVELEREPQTEAITSLWTDLESRREALFDDRHLKLEALRRSRFDLPQSQQRDLSTNKQRLDSDSGGQLFSGPSHTVLTGIGDVPAAHTFASMGRGSHWGIDDYNDVASRYGQINQAAADIYFQSLSQLEHEFEEKTHDLFKNIHEAIQLRSEEQSRLRTDAPPLPDKHRLLSSPYRINSVFQVWLYTLQRLLGQEPSLLPR
jgi:hypothetical protein